MKAEIKVPPMGESIAEAVIAAILAKTGSYVEVDSEVLELETDKVNQVLYAPKSGVLHLEVSEGDTVTAEQILGYIDTEEKEKLQAKKEEPVHEEPPKEEPPKEEPNEPLNQSARYTKENFLRDLGKKKEVQKKMPAKPQDINEREIAVKMSRIRKVIAARMVEAQQQTAMLTTFNEVDLTEVIFLRKKYKEEFEKQHGVKLGFMSFFVKAAVSALEEFPIVNSYIRGDEIVSRKYYDIGIAVGTEKGLIVPVLRNCDSLSFADIERNIGEYAEKARKGSLALADLQGGGFTITNGGVYGSLLSTPLLNPPQCAILGMHKIMKRPVAKEGAPAIRDMMYLALSYDHRLIDGKEAVTFLIHIKNILEDPARLSLEI